MEAFAIVLGFIAVLFFGFGGTGMIEKIFKSKAEIARERRLEAEARAGEARYKAQASPEHHL